MFSFSCFHYLFIFLGLFFLNEYYIVFFSFSISYIYIYCDLFDMGVHVWKINMSVFIPRFTEPGGYRRMHQEPGSLGSLGSRCSGEGGEPQKRCCQRLGEKGSVVTFAGEQCNKVGTWGAQTWWTWGCHRGKWESCLLKITWKGDLRMGWGRKKRVLIGEARGFMCKIVGFHNRKSGD